MTRMHVHALLFLVTSMIAVAATPAPYRFRMMLSTQPWEPFDGTPVKVEWKKGTLVPIPTPPITMQLFGMPFPVCDTVEAAVQGNGTFEVITTKLLVLADGLFTALDSTTSGAHIQYRSMTAKTGSSIRIRYDSVSIANLAAPNYVSFEIQYRYDSGEIAFLFGPSSENTRSITTVSAQPYVGISLQPADFSSMMGKVWLSGDPSAPSIDSTLTLAFPRLHGVPTPGTTYLFTPVTPTSVPDQGSIDDDAWCSVSVDVHDLLGRYVCTTTTSAHGRLDDPQVPRGPVILRNGATHRSRLSYNEGTY